MIEKYLTFNLSSDSLRKRSKKSTNKLIVSSANDDFNS